MMRDACIFVFAEKTGNITIYQLVLLSGHKNESIFKNFLGNLEMTLKYTLQAYLASIMLIRVFNLALVEVIKQIPLCLFLESTTLFNFQCFSFCFMQH